MKPVVLTKFIYFFLAISLLFSLNTMAQSEKQLRAFWPGAKYDPAIPTIKDVIGHDFGEKISSHSEIVRYLKALRDARPEQIELFEYARSHEGRELVYAIISAPEHIKNLKSISADMQALSDPNVIDDKKAEQLIKDLPASTWLAYSVHGNEISSSDAALLTAYHLLAGSRNKVVQRILSQSLVIIDPLQNPDGRDRFVNHYRQTYGIQPDPSPISAEHREPWPLGRTNHYLFDLNRDWFAVTQPETSGKIKAYQEWFPVAYVDLHEMNSESSYYFSPEALPYNPYITQPQRESLVTFGKNNAFWFDEFAFDYFTREVFDAFYPGYGASWPLYFGSISMTYEQASPRGLVMRRNDGSNLTYRQAVHQHFVASIATAQTVAKNRKQLLTEFYQYRKSAIKEGAQGDIKEYIIPEQVDTSAVRKLVGLLELQGVKIRQSLTSFEACGKLYPSKTYTIPLNQPSSRFIANMLEPAVPMAKSFTQEQERRRLKALDTEIYDVTAWSLPLMFNVAIDSCSEIATGSFVDVEPGLYEFGQISGGRAKVAYVVPWGTAASGRLLALSLREKLHVLSADKYFVLNGQSFPAGSLIFKLEKNPPDLRRRLDRIAKETGARVFATDNSWIEDGINFGSNHVKRILPVRIALAWDAPTSPYSAGAARFVLEQQFGYPVTIIRTGDVANRDLTRFQVLILPEQSFGQYSNFFNESGYEKLKNWVNRGGTLIGLGNALDFLSQPKTGLLALKREYIANTDDSKEKQADNSKSKQSDSNRVDGLVLEDEQAYKNALQGEKREFDNVGGVLLQAQVDPDHWLGAGAASKVNVLLRGNHIYRPIKLEDGYNVARFASPDTLLASGYLWQENKAQLAFKPFIVHQTHGRGMVIGFTADPNFRAYMDGLNTLFLNAVFRAPAHARPVARD